MLHKRRGVVIKRCFVAVCLQTHFTKARSCIRNLILTRILFLLATIFSSSSRYNPVLFSLTMLRSQDKYNAN